MEWELQVAASKLLKRAAQAGVAAYVDSREESKEKSNLVEVKRPHATVKPLFLVHAVGGDSDCYYELARSLDYQGAVFGLQMDETVPGTVEGMAEEYVEVIKGIHPDGSYLLGGWSMGGVVAYEMARQLKAANCNVDPLLMIDSYCPNSIPEFAERMTPADEKVLLQTLAAELGITDAGMSAAERATLDEMSVETLMTIFVRLGREQKLLPAEFDLERRFETVLKNSRAVRSYRALPAEIEIQLIRAQENEHPDWSLGWGSLAKRVTVRELPGNHFSLMRQPHVLGVAEVISRLISA
ncbi:MAG TPA: alpha/beta fold hydrolase [Pyrinomonadaceae bacterium]|nr:alpha/beta fold hydrolase [Pyrinomonadaceae bacterium]